MPMGILLASRSRRFVATVSFNPKLVRIATREAQMELRARVVRQIVRLSPWARSAARPPGLAIRPRRARAIVTFARQTRWQVLAQYAVLPLACVTL